jgi:peptide/nickel transport system substrate-binding protein
MNYPPVCLGPYQFKDVDPNGNWMMWQKRADWQKSPAAILGEPKPNYVLFRFWGTEEKRVLAGIQHDLDIFTDVVPESWDVLHQKNPTAAAWMPTFPWADMNDPCERGIEFNTSTPPYDKVEVRWALTLAADIQNISLSTFGGALRYSPIEIPPLTSLQAVYHFPMEPWLTNFALSDGYKPFNADAAANLIKALNDAGKSGLPTDAQAQKELFGVGWWRYDPAEATKLLESVGFKKNADGKWLLPDGTPWKMTINTPGNFEPESGRLGFAVADSWKKFGIDVAAQPMEAAPFWTAEQQGTFDAGSYWPGCGVRADAFNENYAWHKKFVVPTGQNAPGNRMRFANDQISSLLDQLEPLTSKDPQIVPLTTEMFKVFVEQMPWIPMFGTSKFVPTDGYYWTGYPTATNPYYGPWWWWANFYFVLPKLQPTGKTS